ncbi:hypothetical protein [Beggiatoa leptomitoformis]|uniref:Uncharacterized protein n=1 Tax=Beggiatoa leptomitoformis TaxID=288004 RepID=A0A2N9YH37_9GAMM|nr:hypothetical protein [Beggiatoa leptomitoformis]ALG67910.1 hypothetical protein AL038_09545 [Beggiatoa leptomitoformis]AUI69820.1 hypothetical protein BLE401_14725 [Beggiatoa leptomitoformis]
MYKSLLFILLSTLIINNTWAVTYDESQENIVFAEGETTELVSEVSDDVMESSENVPATPEGEPVIEVPAEEIPVVEQPPVVTEPPASEPTIPAEETPVVTVPPTSEPVTPVETPVVTTPTSGPKTTITASLHVFMQENTHRLAGFYFDLPPLPSTGTLRTAKLQFTNRQAGEFISGTFDIFAEIGSHPAIFSLKNPLTPRQLSAYASPYIPHSHWQAGETWSLDVTLPVQSVLQTERCNQAIALIAQSTDVQGYNFERYTVNEQTVSLELTFDGQQAIDTNSSRCLVTTDILEELNALPTFVNSGLSISKNSDGVLQSELEGVRFMLAPQALYTTTTEIATALAEGQISFTLENGKTLVTTPVIQDISAFKQAIKTIDNLQNASISIAEDGKVLIKVNGLIRYVLYPDISSTPVHQTTVLGLTVHTQYWSFVFTDAQGQNREQYLYIVL